VTEPADRPELPTGTITFLRTDVEGSMRLARALGSAWDELNGAQMRLIREAVGSQGGEVVRTEGDAVFAVFREAVPAALAAIDIQRRLASHPWPTETPVRVRVGVHTGEAHLAGDDYGGFDVNRAARISAVGHGGQIVLSDPTRALVAPELPPEVMLRDLGRHALKDVPQPEHLFQLDAPGLTTEFPPIRTGAVATGNLPSRLTSFIAREAELAAITDLLGTARIVTVTGPGGIGKTSLAVEVARNVGGQFPDGAWFVALEPIGEGSGVLPAIARTLGVQDGAGRPVIDGLRHYLSARRTLLLLDNFEHVLDAAADVANLLQASPELRILVTSRAALHIGGEQEYPLGILADAAPDASDDGVSPAARLFVERARAVQPGWELDANGSAVVEDICRLVDGLPLGIELAAARTAVLSPAAIRDRLMARLPLPGSGPRDVPARQRTLDGTIAWSYELLSSDRQQLLRELAVFDGGFDLEQVAGVARMPAGDDPLDALLELADHSLIHRSEATGHRLGAAGIRFRMLETIRTFALRQLAATGEEAETRRRHAEAMLALAETAARYFLGPDQAVWLDRLALDHANLTSALRWSVDAGDVKVAQRLSYATWRYWQFGGHLREGRVLADAVIDMPAADEPSPERMWSLAAAGGLAYWQADSPRARELYRAELETSRQIGDLAGEADAAFNLSSIEFIGGAPQEGERMMDLARERYRQVGDETGLTRTEWGIANVMQMRGDPAGALERLMAAKRIYAETGDLMYDAITAGALAFAHHFLGRPREAFRFGIEAAGKSHAMRDVASTTISLAGAAVMLLDFDRPAEVATLMGAYEGLCEVHGVRPPAGIAAQLYESRVVERAVAALSSEEHAAAVRRGRAMTIDEAVAYAIEVFEQTMGAMPEAQPGGDESGPA
jgi:predicted ATPase/class 3 adenylate cyclase